VPKIVADMHVPPAFRRWSARFALALLIAIAIGYLPGQVVRRDPRAANAALRRQIEALRTDVGAIEDRARADLGLVYPDEIVLRLPPETEASELPEVVRPAGQARPLGLP
jgi:hypothetical protein